MRNKDDGHVSYSRAFAGNDTRMSYVEPTLSCVVKFIWYITIKLCAPTLLVLMHRKVSADIAWIKEDVNSWKQWDGMGCVLTWNTIFWRLRTWLNIAIVYKHPNLCVRIHAVVLMTKACRLFASERQIMFRCADLKHSGKETEISKVRKTPQHCWPRGYSARTSQFNVNHQFIYALEWTNHGLDMTESRATLGMDHWSWPQESVWQDRASSANQHRRTLSCPSEPWEMFPISTQRGATLGWKSWDR